MKVLPVRKPISAGIILSYKCTGECKHCMYACSPKWSNDWISLNDLDIILSKLADAFRDVYPPNIKGLLGLNYGLHFTGGEPFLNFQVLTEGIKRAKSLNIPSIFVETNCFWCINDEIVKERLLTLKNVGLDGILISANPFVVEHVPFERIERGLRIAISIFGERNVIVYHPIFYRQLRALNIRGTLIFKEYLKKVTKIDESFFIGFDPGILLPMGRLVFRLVHLYQKYPTKHFLKYSCLSELTRPWHIHIDCYCNYIPGYCAGISLGDARNLEEIIQGVDLDDKPILKALATNLGELLKIAKSYGYKERKDGYISKCHLCLDIRRYLVNETRNFNELQPREFYEHL